MCRSCWRGSVVENVLFFQFVVPFPRSGRFWTDLMLHKLRLRPGAPFILATATLHSPGPKDSIRGQAWYSRPLLHPYPAVSVAQPTSWCQLRPYLPAPARRGSDARNLTYDLHRSLKVPASQRTPQQQEHLSLLIEAVTAQAESFDARALGKCVNTLSKAREHHRNRKLWEALASAAVALTEEWATRRPTSARARLLALCVNGFAKVRLLFCLSVP